MSLGDVYMSIPASPDWSEGQNQKHASPCGICVIIIGWNISAPRFKFLNPASIPQTNLPRCPSPADQDCAFSCFRMSMEDVFAKGKNTCSVARFSGRPA